jgi:aspartyl/glutamyl-tRNA(Asn/Gln) amidotransferase C subunit
MSKITIEEIERVAKLARIGVTPDEATGLAAELDAIVKFVEQLQQVDIEGVKPTDQVTGLENVTRLSRRLRLETSSWPTHRRAGMVTLWSSES